MRPTSFAALVAVGALACAVATAAAQSGTTAVAGTANIYTSNGNTMNPYSGGGQGTAPVQINLNSGTGRVATFTASGTWGCAGTDGYSVDGSQCAGSGTDLNSSGNISGIVMNGRTMPLVGLFTNGALPGTAPASLTYGGSGIDYNAASFPAPALGQIFFIGDGLTPTLANQFFSVPDSATTLFLGVADGFGFSGDPGYYDDNVGSVSVQYAITGGQVSTTPEPSALLLLGSGLAGLVPMMRRRR